MELRMEFHKFFFDRFFQFVLLLLLQIIINDGIKFMGSGSGFNIGIIVQYYDFNFDI